MGRGPLSGQLRADYDTDVLILDTRPLLDFGVK